jgi:hypothetical protein
VDFAAGAVATSVFLTGIATTFCWTKSEKRSKTNQIDRQHLVHLQSVLAGVHLLDGIGAQGA